MKGIILIFVIVLVFVFSAMPTVTEKKIEINQVKVEEVKIVFVMEGTDITIILPANSLSWFKNEVDMYESIGGGYYHFNNKKILIKDVESIVIYSIIKE